MWPALLLTSLLGLMAVSYSIDPQPVTATAGQSVELPCYIENLNIFNCEYLWSKDGVGISRHLRNVTNAESPRGKYTPEHDGAHWQNITINSLDQTDSAIYECRMSCNTSAVASYSLDVEVDPADPPLEQIHVTVGEKVKLECFDPFYPGYMDLRTWRADDGTAVQEVYRIWRSEPVVSQGYFAETDYSRWHNLVISSAQVEYSMVYRCAGLPHGPFPEKLLRQVALFVHGTADGEEAPVVERDETVGEVEPSVD